MKFSFFLAFLAGMVFVQPIFAYYQERKSLNFDHLFPVTPFAAVLQESIQLVSELERWQADQKWQDFFVLQNRLKQLQNSATTLCLYAECSEENLAYLTQWVTKAQLAYHICVQKKVIASHAALFKSNHS